MSDALASFGCIHLTASGVYYHSARRLEMAGLEHVDGIAVTYSSHPVLVFAAVLAGAGAGIAEDEGRVLAVVVALACFVAFLATRRLALVVHAGNLTVREWVSGSKFDAAKDFVHAVRAAQQERAGS